MNALAEIHTINKVFAVDDKTAEVKNFAILFF